MLGTVHIALSLIFKTADEQLLPSQTAKGEKQVSKRIYNYIRSQSQKSLGLGLKLRPEFAPLLPQYLVGEGQCKYFSDTQTLTEGQPGPRMGAGLNREPVLKELATWWDGQSEMQSCAISATPSLRLWKTLG